KARRRGTCGPQRSMDGRRRQPRPGLAGREAGCGWADETKEGARGGTMGSPAFLISRLPTTRLALVGPAEEGERRPHHDLPVDRPAPVPDVPEVELDALRPRQGGAPVDLRPARDAGQHVEAVQLALVVAVDLVAQRRPRADDRHLAADDVPELRQLVDREL